MEPSVIKIKSERKAGSAGDIAIDDIKFNNCSLPRPTTTYCERGDHMLCRVTHPCIPNGRMCDFTDDCGDRSDEESCPSQQYPYK